MLANDYFSSHALISRVASPLYESVRDNPKFEQLVSEYERRKALAAGKI